MNLKRTIKYRDLFFFSVWLGLKAILSGKVTRESIRRILCPLDISRFYELPKVANGLKLKKGTNVLDISSPKLLVYFLAKYNKDVTFYAIDKFEGELISWKNIAKPPRNLIIIPGDATKLNYPDNFFEEVFSVSVIEHVGNGNDFQDSVMVKEIYRVLKREGRFVFTTIVSNKAKTVYKDSDPVSSIKIPNNKVFFCRIYNYKGLEKTVLNIKPFKRVTEEICNYKHVFYEQIFNNLMFFSLLLGWLNYVIAPLMISTTENTRHIGGRAEYFATLEK